MRVLVPTDFSGNAWKTLRYITKILEDAPSSFLLLNTYEIPIASTGEIIKVNDRLMAESNKKLVNLKQQIESLHQDKNHQFSHLAVHGDFLRVVKRVLKEEKIDLIAISACEKYYPDDLGHNEYAKIILDTLRCPVLTIPCY